MSLTILTTVNAQVGNGKGFVATVQMKTFGDRLKHAREARGLSLEGLAVKLGLKGTSASMVQKWEAGRQPGADRLEQLVRVLDVDGDWLLTGDGEMERGEKGTGALRLQVIGKLANGTLDDDAVRALAATSDVADGAEQAVRMAGATESVEPKGGGRRKGGEG